MLVQGFSWRLPTEGLARTNVERVGHCFDLLAAPSREVSALGKVLAQESIRVLVGAALPRTLRIGEVHGNDCLNAEASTSYFGWLTSPRNDSFVDHR